MSHQPPVRIGLDVLVHEEMARLRGLKVALLGNPASVNRDYVHLLDLCRRYDVGLVRLFGPEHGLLGDVQYMAEVANSTDPRTGLEVVSLYGATRDTLFLKAEDLRGVDVLVCDLQDIGSRYYTYAYTIAFAMQACAQAGVRCMVLDRPNPIGGVLVEGNEVKEEYRSFVGEYPLPNRTGLTLGELCRLFRTFDSHNVDLEVVWAEGWKREMFHDETGAPWVMPSPNMPTPTTALVYPGACIFEGTNISEGRGTTLPFEILGAPFVDPFRWLDLLEREGLPGVRFRPCYFQPTFDKHTGKRCGGVQLHIEDRRTFRPLLTYVSLLRTVMQFSGFDWRRDPYEYVSDRLAIDLLFGDVRPREMLEQNAGAEDVMAYLSQDAARIEKRRQEALYAGYES